MSSYTNLALLLSWPGVKWGSSPPNCNTNGYLVFTGEANAQLSLSCFAVLGTWGHCGTVVSPCGLLVLPQEDLPQVPEWCTRIPVLVYWAEIAVFCTAAI